MIEDVDYTASGYIQAIAPDGTVISRHRQEREAQQACFQHAKDNEDLLGDGVHDYILRSPDVRMSIRLLGVGGNPTNEDTTPPDPPAGVFNNSVTSTGFTTNWTNGPESDLQEHNVYRSSTGPGSGFSLVDTVTVPTASYSHSGLTAETQYWVYVTALDSSGNESVASSVVSSTTSAASSEPYDLYATDTQSRGVIPFAVNWPTEPTITSTSTATTFSELNAAIQVSGRHVTVVGDCSGSLSAPANDIWIELSDGAVMGNYGGVWDFGFGGVQRMKISSTNARAGIYRGGITFPTDTTDVMIDGVTFAENTSSGTARHNIYDSSRIAIINSLVTGNNFTLLANTGVSSDVILANTHFLARSVPSGGNGAIRLKDITRLIIVDVYGDTETNDTGFEPLRLEDGLSNVWVRNFDGDGGGLRIADMGSGEPASLWIYDSRFYWDGFPGINHSDGTAADVTNLTMEDVTFYGGGVTPGSNVISSPQPSWNITNVVYQTYVGRPSWSFE